MPSVPQKPSAAAAPVTQLPDPNHPHDPASHTREQSISHQPSPAVIASASHLTTHVLPRRFLGPMPEAMVNSKEAEESQAKMAAMRKRGLRRLSLPGPDDESRVEGTLRDVEGRRGILRHVHRLRVRRSVQGRDVEQDVELESNDSEDEEGEGEEGRHPRLHRKRKKKKRKDVWVGESFDIGQEFLVSPTAVGDVSTPPNPTTSSVAPSEHEGMIPKRPAPSSRGTTQESFVTARTELSNPSASRLDVHLSEGGGAAERARRSSSSSTTPSLPNNVVSTVSQTSSLQRLIPAPIDEEGESTLSDPKSKRHSPTDSQFAGKTGVTKFRARLKSAIRKPSITSVRTEAPGGPAPAAAAANRVIRPKTVQFPVDLEDHEQSASGRDTPNGDQEPADPEAVLSREGEDAAGTSHEAAADAQETDEDEGDVVPGQVIMRGELFASSRADEPLLIRQIECWSESAIIVKTISGCLTSMCK